MVMMCEEDFAQQYQQSAWKTRYRRVADRCPHHRASEQKRNGDHDVSELVKQQSTEEATALVACKSISIVVWECEQASGNRRDVCISRDSIDKGARKTGTDVNSWRESDHLPRMRHTHTQIHTKLVCFNFFKALNQATFLHDLLNFDLTNSTDCDFHSSFTRNHQQNINRNVETRMKYENIQDIPKYHMRNIETRIKMPNSRMKTPKQ